MELHAGGAHHPCDLDQRPALAVYRRLHRVRSLRRGVHVLLLGLPAAGPAVVVLLASGGACYILGAIVYALRKPDPWPRVFGFHEIFHCGTVAGYACHMVAIYMVIVHLWP
ncbi:MAG: hemolysin III family protein [Bifidobacterium longum]